TESNPLSLLGGRCRHVHPLATHAWSVSGRRAIRSPHWGDAGDRRDPGCHVPRLQGGHRRLAVERVFKSQLLWETRHRRFEAICRGQICSPPNRGGVSMWRNLILAAGLFACPIPAGTFAQEYRKTVTVEVYWPEGARLFIEGQEARSKGPMRRFVSPP